MKRIDDKVISLNGIIRAPKDSADKDGGCDEVFGLRYKDGSWRPVGDLEKVEGWDTSGLSGEYDKLFIHTMAGYRHLFGLSGNNLYWVANIVDGAIVPTEKVLLMSHAGIKSISQTGHLVSVNTSEGVKYMIFRELKGEYQEIVTDFNTEKDNGLLPYGSVDFKVETVADEKGRPFWFNSIEKNSGYKAINNKRDPLKLMEVFNPIIYKTKKGIDNLNYFHGAFALCTAAQLYDGTYILQSQPVILNAPAAISRTKMNTPFNIVSNLTPSHGRTVGGWGADITSDYDVISSACDAVRECIPNVSSTHLTRKDLGDVRYGNNMLHAQVYNIRPWSVTDKLKLLMYDKNGQLENIDLKNSPKHDKVLQYRLSTDESFNDVALDVWTLVNPDLRSSLTTNTNGYSDVYGIKNLKDQVQTHIFADIYGSDDENEDQVSCFMKANTLKFRLTYSVDTQYRDVIQNISVFITRQISTIDNLSCAKFNDNLYCDNYTEEPRKYEDVIEELMKETTYYKIGEIPVDFAQADMNVWKELDIEDGVLTNLTQQDRLKVDSVGRDAYDAEIAFPYNGRLHIANYEESLFSGWLMQHFWHNGGFEQYGDGRRLLNVAYDPDKIYGYIKVKIESKTEGDKVVVRPIHLTGSTYPTPLGQRPTLKPVVFDLNPILSYPSKDATEMEIWLWGATTLAVGQNNVFHKKFALEAHKYLNIAYYIDPELKPISTTFNESITTFPVPQEDNNKVRHGNRIKVSLANNPLYFPNETTYAIGNGSILGFGVNAETQPNGQIGNNSLYVFCSDGTFALFVNSTGQITYGNADIISRYVCNNAQGICAIHGGVIFPTEQGLMLLSGREVDEISKPIDGEVFDISRLENMQPSLTHQKIVTYNLADQFNQEDFNSFIKHAVIGYNFYEKELWVSDINGKYSYIRDREGLWTKRREAGHQIVEDFPKSYLFDGGNLLDINKENDGVQQTMFLTRALKLNTQEFKQVRRLIMRGDFKVAKTRWANIGKVNLTDPEAIAGERISIINPEVISLNETTVPEKQTVVPSKVFDTIHAVYDSEAVELVAEAEGFESNEALCLAIRTTFLNGSKIDTGVWKRTGESQTQPEYKVEFEGGQYNAYVRFDNQRVYQVKMNLTGTLELVDLYFPEGWEGWVEDLIKTVAIGDKPNDVYYKARTSGAQWRLYAFNYSEEQFEALTEDTIAEDIEPDTNTKLIYLGMQRPFVSQKILLMPQIYERYYSGDQSITNIGCWSFLQNEIINNQHENLEPVRYNSSHTIAKGDMYIYLDEDAARRVEVGVSSAQAGTYAYWEIKAMYDNGDFSQPSGTGVYTMTNGTVYALIDVNGNTVTTIRYYGAETITWAELMQNVNNGVYETVAVAATTDTISLVSGRLYKIDIAVSSAIYHSAGVEKYVGQTGNVELRNINAQLFETPTSAELLAGLNLSMTDGQPYIVTYGDDVYRIIYTGSDTITAAELIDNIEDDVYETFSEEEDNFSPVATLLLYGSYDNYKWKMIGVNQIKGENRDFGLLSTRNDCKYFRLFFASKLSRESSIEYIEALEEQKMLEKKIR